jgi:hypothetical protein
MPKAAPAHRLITIKIMKVLLTLLLSIFALNVHAAYKCVVNGKTIYSTSKCAQDAEQFSIDKDSDWTMKIKARTAPREDASLNAVRSLPLPDETAGETSPQIAAASRHADTGASSKNTRFACDGRNRCSQMSSCEEATFFLRNCPNQETDGDHDGVPCENQWCQ